MNGDEDFGTNLNHSPNQDYCQFCFQEGHFTDDGITLEQKMSENILIAKEMGIPEDQAKQMVENILPQLKRWRSTR